MACMKRIVILANSIKFGGRCVAGREIDGSNVGGWVRPVSSAEKEEISLLDQRFEDGSRARLLDIVEIEMLKAKPHGCQTENHLIDSSYYWVKVGEFPREKLKSMCEAGPLWINGSSSGGGTNDRIPVAAADQLPSSLMLVRPKNLRIGVERPFEYKKVRAYFGIGSDSYDLGITDPLIKDKYIVKKEGVYPLRGSGRYVCLAG
jgi:hypothetical protein